MCSYLIRPCLARSRFELCKCNDRRKKCCRESLQPWSSWASCIFAIVHPIVCPAERRNADRKSTRLNSSHANISYAVLCLKKKTNQQKQTKTHRQTTHLNTSLRDVCLY